MDPIVIKLQVEVVPAEEVQHLQLRNARLQHSYEELYTQFEGLSNRYSELLSFVADLKRSLR